MQSVTIYLIGHAGSGKYTIAKEIAKGGFKIIDNHLINNPILSLINLDSVTPVPKDAWLSMRKIRGIILDFIADDKKSNFVFTNVLNENHDYDHVIYKMIKNNAEQRNSIFIPIKLKVAKTELRKRIVNISRKERLKSVIFSQESYDKELIKIDDINLFELDISDMSSSDAAEKILNHAKYIKNKI